MVLFYHLRQVAVLRAGTELHELDAFRFGHAGFHLFFVLSGFLMYYIHSEDLGRPRGLLPFAYKRFSRIYPSYWVSDFARRTLHRIVVLGLHLGLQARDRSPVEDVSAGTRSVVSSCLTAGMDAGA